MSLEFRILGPIEVVGESGAVRLGGRKQRGVLAILLLHANQVVPVDEIARGLYGEDMPATAIAQVRDHVSQLRKLLVGDADANGSLLETRAPGYLFRLGPDQLDAARFEHRTSEAAVALARGEAELAAEALREALGLWRGPPLAEFAYDPFAQPAIVRLDELRLIALEQRIAADLGMGRNGALVSELDALVRDHPLREQFRIQLMLTLYRSGRQAEALDVYQETRRVLLDELGIEPSEEIRELEGRILRHDPSLQLPRLGPGVEGERSTGVPPVSDRNPYKGLRAFDEADAPDFFGREALTAHLVEQLGKSRFLAVVGPSGSGKSSVVRAGLVPALRRGALPGSETWPVVDLTPGAYPLEELEAALLRIAVNPPASLIEPLRSDERGLLRAVKRVLPTGRSELVLIVDQLEELFTLVEDEALRTHVLGLIERAVRDPASRLRVVVTLRADFYDRPLLYRGFAELLPEGVVTVVPLSPEEIERAIAAPAGGAGVDLEQGLLAEIVADVLDEPGALPLLQYALTELFERRELGTLTRSVYAEIGGVSGALARRAEELYVSLGPEGNEAARQLFLQLVTLGEGADTRRRVERSQLDSLDIDREPLAAYIDAFGVARLLSFDRDPRTGQPTVEIAHEALLGEWARLREWIDAAREDVTTHRRLAAAASEWEEATRDPSFLLRGSQLARFESWAGASGLAQTALERAYLQASLRERDLEREAEEARRTRERALERRSLNRLRAVVVVLALGALLAAGLTAFAFSQGNNAKRQTRIATARRLAAAAVANLDVDPELSVLLARQAVERASVHGVPLPEAADALHGAVAASRVVLTLRNSATTAVAFSPDGSRVATAGSSVGQAYVWDSRTGRKLFSLRGPLAPIHELAYSPDGSRLAAGTEDGAAVVWDARDGTLLLVLRGAGAGFTAVAFAPDETMLATTDQAGSIRIWDLRRRQVIRTIRTPYPLCGVSWSPDGSRLGTGQCGGSWRPAGRVWDVRTGKLLLAIRAPRAAGVAKSRQLRSDSAVFGLVFSRDGRTVSTSNLDGTADIWNARSGRLLATLSGHTGAVVALSYSPDGKLIATGSTDGTARVWGALSHRLLLVLHGHTAEVEDLAFSPDSRRLATASEDGTVRVWDVTPEGGRDWLTIPADVGGVESVAYPEARHLLTTGSDDGWTKVWNARTGALVSVTPLFPSAAFPSRFDPGAQIHIWVATATSPDGTLAAQATTGRTAATNGLVRIYRYGSNGGAQVLTTLAGHHHGVQSITFSGDGKRIATGNWDGTAVVWDVGSGRPLWTIAAQNGIVERVVFSPDGKLLATAGDDTTVKLWDLKTGHRLLTLHGPTQAVTDLAFNPGGTRLATASLDGTVRVYVLPIKELMAISRSRLTRGWTKAECEQYLPGGRCPRSP